MGIRLQDIADELQISTATVSRSLRNDPLIRPQTRAQVHAMAVRLGYEGRSRGSRRKSGTGAQARPGTHGTLGLLFPAASLAQARQDVNMVQIMEGVMTEAERTGMMLLVHTIQPGKRERMETNPTEVPPMIREKVCQAVIVRGGLHPDDVAFLAGYLPVVSIGRVYHESPVDAVVPDNVDGVRALVTRLAELGHHRLAWVDGHYSATFLEARQAGFVHGCIRNKLDLSKQRFFGPEIYENRRINTQDTLLHAVRTGTTAMVCGNDSIALQVIEALESGGVSVPQDVSVTGFDAQQAAASGRHVTSVDPHFAEMGRAAVRLATQRLTQTPGPPCTLSVWSEIVQGDTIAATAPDTAIKSG